MMEAQEKVYQNKIAELEIVNLGLAEKNSELEKKVSELEEKLAKYLKNSKNSSKPPSSDLFKPNKPKENPKKKTRKPGGQTGQTREMPSQDPNPDKIIKCDVSLCANCGSSLEDAEERITAKRQVKDIPPINVTVTEYQQVEKTCSCGCCNQGKFPEDVKAPIQIGENAKSLLTYLNTVHVIPFNRLAKLSKDLFGFEVSEGSIWNTLKEAGENAQKLTSKIMDGIKKHPWVGSDETVIKIKGQKNWLWTWQNDHGSYYAIEKGRGYASIERHFGTDYAGCLVHDCWGAQNKTQAGRHQQCHPHLLRDLEFFVEKRSTWAYETKKLLKSSHRAAEALRKDDLSPEKIEMVIRQYKKRLDRLLEVEVRNGDEKRLQNRFKKHRESIFCFLEIAGVPFHNNSSERAIRQAKTKQKISGGFRGEVGADIYAALLSVIETAKKHGNDVLEAIRNLFRQDSPAPFFAP